MDPLSLLREFITTGQFGQVTIDEDGTVDFGGRFTFDKNAPTAYKSDQGKGEYYDIESIVFFVQKDYASKFREYYNEVKKLGIKQVTFVDKQDLKDYLTGKSSTSAAIHLSLPELPTADTHIAKKQKHDSETLPQPGVSKKAVMDINSYERQLRDRNSMLSVPGRNFDIAVKLADRVNNDWIKSRNNARKLATASKSSGRYERETEADARMRQLGAEKLGIESIGFISAPGAAPMPSTEEQNKKAEASRPAAPRPIARPLSKSSAHQQQQKLPGAPILLVPAAMTAFFNMFNIVSFLENGTFTPVDVARKEAGGVKKDKIYINRTIGRNKPVKYEITDVLPRDWSRVVGVVCLGKAWQFKQWPHKGAASGDLVDAFQKVCGTYFHYTDEKVDPTVKGWNVKLIGLNRSVRHHDITAAQDFWKHLDAFLQARNCRLVY